MDLVKEWIEFLGLVNSSGAEKSIRALMRRHGIDDDVFYADLLAALFQAWGNGSRPPTPVKFRAWCAVAARHAATAHMKVLAAQVDVDEQALDWLVAGARCSSLRLEEEERRLFAREELRLLEQFLHELPWKQEEALRLFMGHLDSGKLSAAQHRALQRARLRLAELFKAAGFDRSTGEPDDD